MTFLNNDDFSKYTKANLVQHLLSTTRILNEYEPVMCKERYEHTRANCHRYCPRY